jgi:predicted transcriptional regulator
VDISPLQRLRLRFEAAARAGSAKVDWPQKIQGLNYPQTEEKKHPTDLTVFVNNYKVATVRLADDPADVRGVLSHHHDYDPGSYGYLIELNLDGDRLESIRSQLEQTRSLQLRFAILPEAEYRGGLALYGETLGSYPLDPTIFLDME